MIYQDFVLSLQCHYKMKNTMKSGISLLTVLLVIICASCQPKKKTEPEKETITGDTYTNPLREKGAEPWSVFHEGKYYYTQGSESRIILWETSDITNLDDSLKNRYGYRQTLVIRTIYGPPSYIGSIINGISILRQMTVTWTITRFM